MKKATTLVLTFAFCYLLTACGFSSDRSNRTADKPSTDADAPTIFSVYLDLDFEQNLFMATYNIEIYLDEEYVGVIEHGKAFTKQIEAEAGQHTFVFYKETDNSISATKKCDIVQDCTVKCTLHSNTNSIEVKKFSLLEGITGSLTMPKVVDQTYKDAKEQLKKAGFTNVRYLTPRSANIWEEKNWTVVAQNVEPGVTVDKNVEIILSCEKPGYQFNEDTETTGNAITETATVEPELPVTDTTTTTATENEHKSEETETHSSAASKSKNERLEEFMEMVRNTVAQGEGIQVEVKRFTDTVYLDVTMEGMANAARNVNEYGGDYRDQWNYSMEKLRELNEQYRDAMIETYRLRDYNFSLCLMNDEDPDYVLVEFVNGELKRSVVD